MTKDKIKIEELRNYVGTGLNILTGENTVIEFTGFEWLHSCNPTVNSLWFDLEYCKPYVRSLSRLTQEIEHNGEKIVPIVELAKMEFNNQEIEEILSFSVTDYIFESLVEFSFILDNTKWSLFYNTSTFVFTYVNRDSNKDIIVCEKTKKMLNKLYELGFDLHDWLPRDLAIEKKL